MNYILTYKLSNIDIYIIYYLYKLSVIIIKYMKKLVFNHNPKSPSGGSYVALTPKRTSSLSQGLSAKAETKF